ncbi:MAG: methyltransferase domain-containing protein, partial [Cyclobacteriaceae bacterium]
MLKDHFDAIYKQETNYYGQKENPDLSVIIRLISTGDELDLGVGEGRNAMFLARQGFNVTGVDFSIEALNKLNLAKTKENSNLKTVHSDISDFKINQLYHLIISNATLHFLKKKEIYKLVDSMKLNTHIGGINYITAFTRKDTIGDFDYLFEKEEL